MVFGFTAMEAGRDAPKLPGAIILLVLTGAAGLDTTGVVFPVAAAVVPEPVSDPLVEIRTAGCGAVRITEV